MQLRNLAMTSLGNILEWYDFGLFIYLAPTLGKTFFHTTNALSSHIAALSVFATGYLCRPIGGILFGYFGDTSGRAKTLQISILLMSFATLSIGLLPSYQQIGLAASITFILLRILQSIAAGGEYSGVLIYLAESAPIAKRGLITSLANSGANLGFMLASLTIILLNLLCPITILPVWGWRIPFITLGMLGSLLFYFRLRLAETKTFDYMQSKKQFESKPLLAAFRFAPTSLLKIVGLTCMSSIYYIFYFGFLSQYLPMFTKVNFLQALTMQMVLLLLMLFLVPIAGFLGDRWGRKNILFITCALMTITTIPFFNFFLAKGSMLTIWLPLLFATTLSSFDQGNNSSAFVENCPIDVRYSGVGFAYNIGNAIFGGTAPLVFTLLIEKHGKFAPAYYMTLCGIVTLITITTLLSRRETRNLGYFISQED